MKIFPTFRYQLRDQRLPVLVYYGIIVGMLLLSLLATPFLQAGSGNFISTNGLTAGTMIFAFILSLCSFKDSFFMNLQHGISRRSQFIGRLGAMGAACAIMALADELYTLVVAGLQVVLPNHFSGNSLYEMLYCASPTETGFAVQSSLVTILLSVVFSFFALLAASSLGYLVTALMYRLHKMGKILFWVGLPALFILSCSYLAAHPALGNRVLSLLLNASRLCFGSLPRMMLTCTLVTALLSALAWLLMRRAPVK